MSTALTLLAVGLSIVGNFLNSLGFIVEKLGHQKVRQKKRRFAAVKKDEINDDTSADTAPSRRDKVRNYMKTKYVFNRTWWCGLFTYGLGSFIGAASLAFGPQSMLVPLESITLVFNVFLAHTILKEDILIKHIVGTIIIIIGIIIVIIWGPQSGSAATRRRVQYFLDR